METYNGDPCEMTDVTVPAQETSLATCGNKKTMSLAYVLITPARNEAAFIEKTIKSVVAQTVRPLKWVIVSDGSTDGTDEIVNKYAANHQWIELVRLPERRERHFAGKVHAFNVGYTRIQSLPYDLIGNLDGDISFDEQFFAVLLQCIKENPRLGVVGAVLMENGVPKYDLRFTSATNVAGPCQLFRRDCFEDIGGYRPIKLGGVDLTAVLTARMKGWQTETCRHVNYVHHRIMGTASRSLWEAALRGGHGDYRLGMHPGWEVFRCIYQMWSGRPIILSGGLRLVGFSWGVVTRATKVIPEDLVRFRRKEQARRLRDFPKKFAFIIAR